MPPAMMRAIHHEGSAPLRLVEIETPRPGPGEILIRVIAAGVNRPDLVQRAGLYPAPHGTSPTLGLEAAGQVAAVGQGVTRWKEGDHVTALLGGGGYAEYAVADAGAALSIPTGLSLQEAALLPETALTVWANVFEAAALKPREALLVHGGASGIGVAAIQMAKAHGAIVFATAGDDAKTALCESLGAARAINYRTRDFENEIKELGGVDVILDMVGGPYLPKNIAILKEFGRLSVIATLQGAKGEADLMRVMLKRLTITGSTLRARPRAEKARLAAAVEATVWPWVESGAFKAVIDSRYPLEHAEQAHARMASGQHAGKILLEVAPA